MGLENIFTAFCVDQWTVTRDHYGYVSENRMWLFDLENKIYCPLLTDPMTQT